MRVDAGEPSISAEAQLGFRPGQGRRVRSKYAPARGAGLAAQRAAPWEGVALGDHGKAWERRRDVKFEIPGARELRRIAGVGGPGIAQIRGNIPPDPRLRPAARPAGRKRKRGRDIPVGSPISPYHPGDEPKVKIEPDKKRVRFRKGGHLIQPQHVTPGAPPPKLGPLGRARKDRKQWQEHWSPI